MPALKVNIIIVHPWDVVFPLENNTPRVNNYDVHLKCIMKILNCSVICLAHLITIFTTTYRGSNNVMFLRLSPLVIFA